MIQVNNILRSVYRNSKDSDKKFNVLSMCRNNEKYISLLCKTPNNFYILPDHPWNVLIENVPSNLSLLSLHSQPLDCIICYDRAEQYAEAQSIAQKFHIPIILIDMCSESLVRPNHLLESLQPTDPSSLHRKPTLRICNDSYIQSSWNKDSVSIVIPIGIDTDILKSKQSNELLISLDNNIPAQLGAEIATRLQNHALIPTDHDQSQEKNIAKSSYFINTQRTVTVKLLEAMACENIVIAVRNADTENFITHEKTGILINDLNELLPTIQKIEGSPEIKEYIQKESRQKIIKEHSLEKFISKWLAAFSFLKSNFYTPHQ